MLAAIITRLRLEKDDPDFLIAILIAHAVDYRVKDNCLRLYRNISFIQN